MNTATLINNAATVTGIYEAFVRGDIPSIIENIDSNCVWTAAGEGFLPAGGTYRGKDAVNFFIRLGESFEFSAFNPVLISNLNDDEVVAFGNLAGNSKLTGKSTSTDWAMHWKFNDDGKVIYYQDFHDTAAAYAAIQP
jgi:uncharacterized protein